MNSALLQCVICPEKPRFSDSSHLLTHVASKAHLSYYFKLQVRSQVEPEATELLAEYDNWYSTNGLAQLLSERMTSKEDRKKNRRSQTKETIISNGQRTQRRWQRSNPKETPSPEVSESADFPDFLDPRLVDSPEQEKNGMSAHDASLISSFTTSTTPVLPHAHTAVQTTTGSVLASITPTGTLKRKEHEENRGDTEKTYPTLPETPKRVRTRGRQSQSSSKGRNKRDPFMDDEMRTEALDEIDADKERADEMARLKGVLWPGMDIFDSATQQMRRKRNQKKDQSVLKMMEMTSLQVEPTELIFSPTGSLQKQRVISGNVEDYSPLKGETPIPKRRMARPKKQVLRRVDPNVLRAQDRKKSKNTTSNNRKKTPLENFENHDGSPCPLPAGLKGMNSAYENDSEIGLAVQAFGKRRGAFTIFADEDGPDQFQVPKLPRDTLTPARLILDHKLDIGNQVAKLTQPTQDKENIEPIMNTHGRIDFPDWNSPFPRQSDTDNAGYAPRYYYDETTYGGLGPDDELGKIGHRSNPLVAPESKLGYYEASSYGNNATMNANDWTNAHMHHREASSEATISEQDQHDLAQLYLATSAD
ncbi:hypothetical protein N7454_004535 [Penicillium verhagenii]|nr:hypothetical protein N7454_004535 [Penicillium verhagenii]